MNIFKLFGTVVLDGASEVNGQLDSIDTKGSKAGKAFGALGSVAKGVGVAVSASAAGVTALGAAVTKMAASNDVIDKMSQKVGISTTAYQEWSYAMGQSGVDIGMLQTSMVKVTSSAQAAIDGNKGYAASFDELGVSITDADGKMRSQEDILNDTMLALADVEDTTKRAVLGQDLFGKSFSTLNPLLNAGSQGITDYKDRAHELGLVIDEDIVKSSASFGDTVSDMKDTLGALATNTLAPLLPVLGDVASSFTNLLAGKEGASEEFSGAISGFITKGIETIVNLLPSLIETGTTILFSLIEGLSSNTGAIVDTVASILLTLVDAIITNLPQLITAAIDIVLGLANGIVDNLPLLIEKIPDILIAVVNGLIDNLPTLILAGPKLMIGLAGGLIDAIPVLVASIPQIVTAIVGGLSDAIPEFIEMGKQIVAGLVQGLKDKASAAVDAVKDVGGKIANGFKNFFGIKSPSKLFAGFGKFMMEGLGEGLTDNAKLAINAATGIAGKIAGVFGGVAKGLAGAVVSSSSVLSGAVAGWESARGADTKDDDGEVTKGKVDFAGGISGILMSLLESSAPFQEMMEKLSPLIQMVADFFGQLITPLMPLVDILADLLPTILQSLMPIMEAFIWMIEKVIVPVVGFLSNLITSIYNGVVDIVNWIISFLNKIPFVNISWRMSKADGSTPSTATSSDSTKEASSKGGTQLSAITGPTRDLLSDLLSPLASLNTLTGTTNRIYDLLDARLGNGMGNKGLVIQNVTVNTNGVDGRKLGTDFMDAVEAELSRRGNWNARGYANA